jgi:hypothetical protein
MLLLLRACNRRQEAKLKHPHHKTFHKTVVSEEDEANGIVRLFCFSGSPPRALTDRPPGSLIAARPASTAGTSMLRSTT